MRNGLALARRAAALAPALVLVAVSAWEIAATVSAGADVGARDDWAAAARAVRAAHRDGDLIVFAPRWIDPVGREHLGDLIPVAMAARMDAARYARVWELSVRGARAPETRGARLVWERAFGPVTVRRYAQTPAEVVTDFIERFAGARVDGAFAARSRDRAVPPAVDLEEVGYQPHRCVRVVPQPGRTVRVVYPHVALGSRLVGHVGLADAFTRRDDREPGRLVVRVSGRAIAEVTFGVDDGWVRFEADTRPGPAEVVFEATAVGAHARNRLICFAAEARR